MAYSLTRVPMALCSGLSHHECKSLYIGVRFLVHCEKCLLELVSKLAIKALVFICVDLKLAESARRFNSCIPSLIDSVL